MTDDDVFYSSLIEGGLFPIEQWAQWEPIEGEDAYRVWNVVGGVRIIRDPFLVDVHTVAKGWLKLRRLEQSGQWSHCNGTGTRLTAIDADRQFGGAQDLEFDRCIVDAVIQMGLFGSVRYGPNARKGETETRAVYLALERLHDPRSKEPEAITWAEYQDLNAFIGDAQAALRDRSELTEQEIGNADWSAIYQHYRSYSK